MSSLKLEGCSTVQQAVPKEISSILDSADACLCMDAWPVPLGLYKDKEGEERFQAFSACCDLSLSTTVRHISTDTCAEIPTEMLTVQLSGRLTMGYTGPFHLWQRSSALTLGPVLLPLQTLLESHISIKTFRFNVAMIDVSHYISICISLMTRVLLHEL